MCFQYGPSFGKEYLFERDVFLFRGRRRLLVLMLSVGILPGVRATRPPEERI